MIENYQEAGGRVALVNYDEVRADLRTVIRESQEVGRDINTEIIDISVPFLVLAGRLRDLCWPVPETGLAQRRLLQNLRWSRRS